MALENPVRDPAPPASALRRLWPGLINRLPKAALVVPMIVQWLILAARYRSLSLPSAADPSLFCGGLAGESKMDYFAQVEPTAAPWVARTGAVVANAEALANARTVLAGLQLSYPVIAKPDVGWCGFGVRRLANEQALVDYIAAYPAGERFLLQEYLGDGGEAGLFYVRWPGEKRGRLESLTVREPPFVVGDGATPLRRLVMADDRLGPRLSLFEDLDRIPAAGERAVLSVVWSHRSGGRYRDLSAEITDALEARIDAIASGMPQLHVARFDVRFGSMSALAGGDFKIIEVNGAGSEAINFFDPSVPFFTAYGGVLRKQAMVFALAAENRRRGVAPCGAWALLLAFRRQHRLLGLYPRSN